MEPYPGAKFGTPGRFGDESGIGIGMKTSPVLASRVGDAELVSAVLV